ncbi:MAG TPA: hypothetical protein VFX70_16205 [Mycobacteriales bacterium]|nr:hypothetical protein [Mycobacteriales bacterium]
MHRASRLAGAVLALTAAGAAWSTPADAAPGGATVTPACANSWPGGAATYQLAGTPLCTASTPTSVMPATAPRSSACVASEGNIEVFD